MFDNLTADIPTPLRLIHQQPVDDQETEGEVSLRSVTVTVDQGRLALSNVASNQVVGMVRTVNFYTHRAFTNLLVYVGRETNAPQRHVFNVVSSVGSSTVAAKILAQDDPSGNGVRFDAVSGIFPFNPGGMFEYQFTTPNYLPHAAAGIPLNIRVESVSQQWMAPPGSDMRVIQITTRTVN